MLKKFKVTGGHVGLCIGKKAHVKVWPEVAEWIKINYINSNLITNIKTNAIVF